MTSPTVDRRFGLVGNAANKAPVAAVATANIVLSGQQIIDGVTPLAVNAAGVADRVLCVGQTNATQNGIYDVSLSAWSRSADADGPYDFAKGSQVLVTGGTTYAFTAWCLTTAAPITVGTSALTWQLGVGVNLLTAVQAAQAYAAQAGLSEAQAAAIVLGNFLQTGTGARARTFTSKAREWVSVMDFGAIGDGANHLLSERYATLAAAQIDFPFVTALTQSIDWAAFQAAHNSLSASNSYVGGRIIVPSGSYFLSNTWAITKRVAIEGAHGGNQGTTAATRLTFPADVDGIRLYSNIDSSTGTGADFTSISRLNLAASAKNASGHGIHSTTVVYIDQCTIASFKGDGIFINGQTGGGATGIADCFEIRNTRCDSNGGNGVRLVGNDTNVGKLIGVQGLNNTGYGFYDNSTYCCTHIACQVAGNVAGSFYSVNATNLGSLYLGCYIENDAGSLLSLTSNNLWVGGVAPGPIVNPTNAILAQGTGITLNLASPGGTCSWVRGGASVGVIDIDNRLYFAGAKFTSSAGNIIDILTNTMSMTTTNAGSAGRIFFNNPNGTVGTITTNGSATAYATSSDYRLKDNVQPMVGAAAIARIMALRPVKYTWKADGAAGEGFIAHELQQSFPHAVTGEKDAMQEVDVFEDIHILDEHGKTLRTEREKTGTKIVPNYQGVDTSFLAAPMVAMLQEQQEQIAALAAKVEALEARQP